MTEDQKDTMIANILEGICNQIHYLTSQGLIDDAYALYQEWEEHFDDDVKQVEIITITDLTTI